MGKYFGRQPRYSQEEAEAQARQAIDAAVSRGRPPAEEWKGLAGRMGEINQELANRPRVDLPPPPPRAERRPVRQVLRPLAPEPEPEPAPEPAPAPRPVARRPAVKKAPVAKPAPAATRAPAVKKAPAAAKKTAAAAPKAAAKKTQTPAAKRPPAKKRTT